MAYYDNTIADDFDKYMSMVKEVKDWLNRLYYKPGLAATIMQTKLSIIMTAANFIDINLSELKLFYMTTPKTE